MEGSRFDAMAIALGTRRRAVLAALLTGGLGSMLGRAQAGAGPAACQGPGQVCRTRADCCATRCRKKQGKREGRCKACGGGRQYCGGACCRPGEDCVGGACVCPGCVDGEACVPGTSDDACGAGGGACAACAAGQRCLGNGSCAISCTDQDRPCGSCAQGASNCSPESSGQLVCWFTGAPDSTPDGGCGDTGQCPQGYFCYFAAGYCYALCA
jgi:hypothetical protein